MQTIADPDSSPCVFSKATGALISVSQDALDVPTLNNNLANVAQRVKELEPEIQALKICRNAATVTYRLPSEILSSIFLFVQEGEHGKPKYSYAWISVAHVCRYWRRTALDCAALWAHLDCRRSPMLTELLLQRSAGAVLSVTYKEDRVGLTEIGPLVKVLSQVDRIRSLTLSEELSRIGSNGALMKGLLEHCTGDATNLEKFDLELPSCVDFSTLPNFLRHGMPNISHLRLMNCDIPWRSLPHGPHMTVLILVKYSPTNRPSEDEFFETMAQVPALHTLHLLNFLPEPEAVSALHTSQFTFPSLRALTVCDTFARLRNFFRLARSHTVTSSEVELILPFGGFPSGFLDDILAFSHRGDSEAKRNIRQLCVDAAGVAMDFDQPVPNQPSESAIAHPCYLSISRVYIMVDSDVDLLDADRLLDILCQRFNFQTLRHWTTSGDPDGMIWDLESHRFFARLPNLKTVTFNGTALRGFLIALGEDKGIPGTPSQVPFPRLMKLTIIRFYEPWQRAGTDETNRQTFMSAFISFAKLRSRAACPISELRIEESGRFQERHIAHLRRTCPGVNVVWVPERPARGYGDN